MSFKKKDISDDAPVLADSHDGSVAAPASSDSSRNGPAISKRTFLKGAATVPFAAVGAKYSVGRSRAIAPAVGVGVALAGGAAVGYLTREIQEKYTGDDYNKEEYQDASEDILYQGYREKAMSMAAADDTVMTVLENRLQDSRSVSWAKAKKAIIEALNNGKAETDALADGVAQLDSYYTVIQKNFANHYIEQMNKFDKMIQNSPSTYNGSVLFKPHNSSGPFTLANDQNGANTNGSSTVAIGRNGSKDITLLDGTTLTIPTASNSGTWTIDMSIDSISTDSEYSVDVNEIRLSPVEYSSISETKPFLQFYRYVDLWNEIQTVYDDMKTQVQSWVSSAYTELSEGQIDTTDIIDPTTLAQEYATDYENTGHYSYAGADLAMLGVTTDFDALMTIELHQSAQTVKGQVFAAEAPQSGGFDVGTKYYPSNLSGTVYLAYETVNENDETVSDLIELQEPFTIMSAETPDGESLDTVTLRDYNAQTSDVNVTQEELNQLQELTQELKDQQEAAAQNGGGGGFSFDQFAIGDIPGVATIAMIGGGILLLMNDDD